MAVPPESVLEAVKDCAARGVRAAVILSSGFSEMGEAGSRLQAEIGSVARSSGMRVVGPELPGLHRRRGKEHRHFLGGAGVGVPDRGPRRHRLAERQPRQLHDAARGRSRHRHQPPAHHRQRMRRRHRRRHRLAGHRSRPPSVILCCMETCRDAGKLRAGAGDGARGRQAHHRAEGRRVRRRQRSGCLAHRRAGRFGRGVRRGAAERRRHPGAEHRAIAGRRPCRLGGRRGARAEGQSRRAGDGLRRLRRADGRCGQRPGPGSAEAFRAHAGAHPLGAAVRVTRQSGRHDRAGVEPAGAAGAGAVRGGGRSGVRCGDPAVRLCLPDAAAARRVHRRAGAGAARPSVAAHPAVLQGAARHDRATQRDGLPHRGNHRRGLLDAGSARAARHARRTGRNGGALVFDRCAAAGSIRQRGERQGRARRRPAFRC